MHDRLGLKLVGEGVELVVRGYAILGEVILQLQNWLEVVHVSLKPFDLFNF